jgi:3'-phosphoadenosine 5'-phosphosulfate sulfotransferase (PAPS reductase)/FAD synthetase
MHEMLNTSMVESIAIFQPTPPRQPWGINFGAGTNSWAMALACHERGLRPDWCLFADTGSETPETYRSVEQFREWSAKHGWPFEIVRWIRKDGTFESIHENCLRTGYLPSKAYQLAGCTSKWKIQPMQKWRSANGYAESAVAIGYDAGERARIEGAANRYCSSAEVDLIKEMPWYPLVAWGIDRKGCHEINKRWKIEVGKSSCFCCPNMRESEWEELKAIHPELYAIAERIEDQAIAKGNAETARLFKGKYRNGIVCSCFLEDELPEESWLRAI